MLNHRRVSEIQFIEEINQEIFFDRLIQNIIPQLEE